MRSRVSQWLAVSMSVISLMCLPQASRAEISPKVQLSITGLEISTESAHKHVVTLLGTVTNPGETSITKAAVSLMTSGAIYTRSQLGEVLANPQSVQGTSHSEIRMSLGTLARGKSVAWKLRFDGDKILGSSASGVYALGANLISDQVSANNYITAPWFYSANKLAPTKVSFVVPLTTINSHIANEPLKTIEQDQAELTRLSALVNAKNSNALSWLIDPALQLWLTELATTELASQANALSAQITKLAPRSMTTPFGHANLAGLATSHQNAEISRITDYGNALGAGRGTAYAAPRGTLTNRTFKELARNNITPIVSNEFSTGNSHVTSSAYVNYRNHGVIVFDRASSDCLANRVTANTAFRQSMCLASEIGMMTAESPAVSRTVVVLAPSQWAVTEKPLSKMVSNLQRKQWVSLIPLSQVMASNTSQTLTLPDYQQQPMSPRTLRLARAVKHNIKIVGSMVVDPNWKKAVAATSLLGYSDLWITTSQAHAYLTSQLRSIQSISHSVRIQTSSRITIASTHADIPITVANASNQDVRISVTIASNTPGKFTAKPSALVTVPVGKRVTVSVPISLAGTGVIDAKVELIAPNGLATGPHFDIRISSTAYQKVASTLVRLAFGILIALAVSNFIRRRRTDKRKDVSEL